MDSSQVFIKRSFQLSSNLSNKFLKADLGITIGFLPLMERGLQSSSVGPQDVTNVKRLCTCYKGIFRSRIDMPTLSMNNIPSLVSKYVQNTFICMFQPNPALKESACLLWFDLRLNEAKSLQMYGREKQRRANSRCRGQKLQMFYFRFRG